MRSRILQYGHPLLRKEIKLANIEDGSANTKTVNKLCMMLGKIDGYGLAANQAGIDAQIFTFRYGTKKFQTILNPTIEESSDEQWSFREGCLSIPGWHWYIDRPRRVMLNGYDIDGNEISVEADDTLGRIFQHEVDHFNGVLVIDKLPPEDLKEFEEKWNTNQR